MAVYYIARQRSLDFSSPTPIVQLISNPAVNACQRCRYCYFLDDPVNFWQTRADYEACIKEHACGRESLFWVKMTNGNHPPLDQPSDYTPTPLIRSVKVELQSRYLQFFTIDIQGYSCNSLCHYYPNRIATKQSVAACSSAHGCGRNGSFFRLLVILDDFVFNIPDWFNTKPAEGEANSTDGFPILLNDAVLRFSPTDPTLFVAYYEHSGFEVPIINMVPGSIGFGSLLKSKRAGQMDLLYWETEGWYYVEDRERALMLQYPDDTLYQMLLAAGITENFILNGRPYLTLLGQDGQADLWTYMSTSMYAIKTIDERKYVQLKYIGISRADYVKIAIGTEKWLCLESYWSVDTSYSAWTTTTTKPADITSSSFMVITSPFDALAMFLKNVGVKPTIFK